MTIEEFESQLHAAAAELISEFNAKFPEYLLKIRTRDTDKGSLRIELVIGYRDGDGKGIDFIKPRWVAQAAYSPHEEIAQCLEELRSFIHLWETRQPTAMLIPGEPT
jgi:hypothetical protein